MLFIATCHGNTFVSPWPATQAHALTFESGYKIRVLHARSPHRAVLHDDDAPKDQRLPSTMTVEPVAWRARDKGELRSGLPHEAALHGCFLHDGKADAREVLEPLPSEVILTSETKSHIHGKLALLRCSRPASD